MDIKIVKSAKLKIQSMIQTALTIFKIKSFVETPLRKTEGGPELLRGSFVLAYEGEIQGEGILEELKVRFSEKRAAMTGLMYFKGRIDQCQGSFVLRHTGKYVNGRVTATQTVVPGSATESLKGLRGEMKLESAAAQSFSATFRYRFA